MLSAGTQRNLKDKRSVSSSDPWSSTSKNDGMSHSGAKQVKDSRKAQNHDVVSLPGGKGEHFSPASQKRLESCLKAADKEYSRANKVGLYSDTRITQKLHDCGRSC